MKNSNKKRSAGVVEYSVIAVFFAVVGLVALQAGDASAGFNEVMLNAFGGLNDVALNAVSDPTIGIE